MSITNERGRKERRHSSFWLRLSSTFGIVNDDFIWEECRNFNEVKSS